MDYHIFPTS